MQEFKVGDKIKFILVNMECSGEVGSEFEVILNNYGNPSVMTKNGYCEHKENWQLISPKERTIEEVVVGDVIYTPSGNFYNVLEVTDNLVAIRYVGDLVDIYWRVKKELDLDGWKIKQPEPEIIQGHTCSYPTSECSRCEKSEWLEKGEKEGWLKEGRIVV